MDDFFYRCKGMKKTFRGTSQMVQQLKISEQIDVFLSGLIVTCQFGKQAMYSFLLRILKTNFHPRAAAVLCILVLVLPARGQQLSDTAIIYVHKEAPGVMVHVLKTAARLFLPENSISEKLSRESYISKPAAIPKKMFSGFIVDTIRISGRNVFTISPRGEKSGKYVLFLHGGAYINNVFRQHWLFAARIIRETNCTVVVPDYPLAPACTYREAYVMLEAVYKHLLHVTDAKNIILLGDSAGGGLALALSMKQRDDGIAPPSAVILLSPWLDISMTNPRIPQIQKKDVTLSAENLVLAGKAWAGNTETTNYLVSPVYGSLEGLPQISVFIGTHDILLADCRKLKMAMEQQGIPMNYFEYPGLFHDWMMLGTLKESKVALSQICWLIMAKKL